MPKRNIVARTWPNDYNIKWNIFKCFVKNLIIFKFESTTPSMSQHITTRRNRVAKRTQHVAPNNVAICCDMLRWNVAIVCPGLHATSAKVAWKVWPLLNLTEQHPTYRKGWPNAHNMHAAPSNVAICCVAVAIVWPELNSKPILHQPLLYNGYRLTVMGRFWSL